MDGWMIVHRREDNAFLNSLNTYHSVCIFRLGNCDPITQTSPVPLLGVRGLLLAFGRLCQIWRNCLSQVGFYSMAVCNRAVLVEGNVMLDFIPKHLPIWFTLYVSDTNHISIHSFNASKVILCKKNKQQQLWWKQEIVVKLYISRSIICSFDMVGSSVFVKLIMWEIAAEEFFYAHHITTPS
jgi:hypothetical protein